MARQNVPFVQGALDLDLQNRSLRRANHNWQGGAMGVAYAAGDIVVHSNQLWVALRVNDNVEPTTANSADWMPISSSSAASTLTIEDEGTALTTAATTLNFVGAGVTATGTGAEKTITITGGGGGGNVAPDERFTYMVSTRSIPETVATGSAPVSVTIIGVEAPYTYQGFNGVTVNGPVAPVLAPPTSGTGASFSFRLATQQAGAYQITFNILSNDAGGTAQPLHQVTFTVEVTPGWYSVVRDSAPTDLSDFGASLGGYVSGVETTFSSASDSTNRGYIALPDTISPTFTSGALILSSTSLGDIGSDHTLYRIDDFLPGAAVTDTLTVEVTNG